MRGDILVLPWPSVRPSVHRHTSFPDIILRMPSPIDATFCRLIGLYERKVPFENQPRCKNKMAAMAAILNFGFRTLSSECLHRMTRYFVGWLDFIRGRFLSKMSPATKSIWPPWQPFWIWFPFIILRMPSPIDATFCMFIGLPWRKVPFENEPRHKINMAATASFNVSGIKWWCRGRHPFLCQKQILVKV